MLNMSSFFIGKNKELRSFKPSSKIVVASGARGSGVSIISSLLAFELSKRGSTALVELGRSHFFDALDLEKALYTHGFINYFEKIKANEHIEDCFGNEYKGINWIVRAGGENSALNPAELFRSLYLPRQEYCIFDCSGIDNDIALALMAESDFAIAVIDPLPSKLSESRAFLERLRISLPKTILMVNSMNPGVHKSEFDRFLGTKDYFSVPSVPQEYIYKAEYNCKLVWELPEVAKNMAKTQDMLYKLFYEH